MAPRSYDSSLRQQKQAELAQRIAAAAAALHAQKGALGTSYADIAAAAGVSLPTVYAHYPTQSDLLAGCTRHVAALAPPLPVQDLLAAPDLPAAIDLLVTTFVARHVHFEPWQAWRENRVIPFLAELSAQARGESTALVTRMLRRHLGNGSHRDTAAAWETILSFDHWHRLARAHGLSRPAVHRAMAASLAALAASATTKSPARKPR